MKRISLLLLLPLIMAVGCSEPPDERAGEVRARIEAIDTTEACVYLNDLCSAIKDTFKVAYEEMEVQKDKSFISKSFDRAERLLDVADSMIQSAQDSIPKLREYYGRYIESIRVRAENGYDSATVLFEEFRAEPENAERAEQLSRKMIDMTMTFGRAKTAFKEEDYLRAGTQFEQVIRFSNSLIARMK